MRYCVSLVNFQSSPEGSVTSRSINQEVLELLDSQKLPMNERVFTWLTNSVPDKQTKPTVNKTSEDILKSANVTTQANKRDDSKEIACTKTEIKKQDQNMTTKTSCEQMVPKDKPLETQVELELQHEKTLREKIEKQLAQEKEKREQLEQEDKLETQTRLELQREKTRREKLEKQLAQEREKRQQLKQKVEPIKTKRELELQHKKTLRERLEKQLAQEKEKRQQLEQEVSERRITVTQKAQKVDVATSNHQQNSSSVVGATSSKHSTAHTPTNRHNPIVSLSAKTPQSSGRSNIRYANSAYIYQNGIQRLLRKTKQDKSIHSLRGKPPNTCANAHSLVEHVHQHRGKENFARHNHHKENAGKTPTKAVRERADDIYIAEVLHQSNKSHDNKPDGNVKENISTTVRKRKQTNPTKRIHNQKSPQQISSPVYHTPDVTRHQHSSIPHLVRDSSCSFLSQQLPSSGCDHHCLGCKPRLKCPLITSRNFVKLLRVDRFTCAYHRRLASRIMGGLKEVPTTKPVGNRQPVVYMNQPSGNSSESSSATSPVSSEVFNQSPCSDQENSTSTYDTSTITSDTSSPAGSDIDCHKMPSPSQYVDVHNQISACDANRSSSNTYEGYSTTTSDSEYIPSGSTQSLSSSSSYSCMKSKKCVGKNTLTLPGKYEAVIPKDNTTSKTLSTASRLTRPLVPAVYKLVPGSCKPAYNQVKASEKGSSTIQPRPKLKLLKDVTNQARGRSNMPSSVVPPQKPLAVFDYSTPDGKAGEKYLPQRATKVRLKC